MTMAASKSMKKSPLTPSTITPPSINRQHSYTAAQPLKLSPTDAKNILSQVASRAASPRRTSPTSSPLQSPTEVPHMERRRSWEDCVHQRDGYISFPDFDQLKESSSRTRSGG